jgi:electron transport complex protein RnfA
VNQHTPLTAIIVSSVFVNNIILMRFLGLCSFFGVSNRFSSATGMSAATLFVMLMATVATWAVYWLVLVPLNLVFLKIIVFILVISSLVQLVEMFLKRAAPALFNALGIYLPLITTNCAILAVTFLTVEYRFDLGRALLFAGSVGAGYTIAIVMFASVRERLELAPLPNAVKGYGIVFVTAGLMSLAFMGLTGLFGY